MIIKFHSVSKFVRTLNQLFQRHINHKNRRYYKVLILSIRISFEKIDISPFRNDVVRSSNRETFSTSCCIISNKDN